MSEKIDWAALSEAAITRIVAQVLEPLRQRILDLEAELSATEMELHALTQAQQRDLIQAARYRKLVRILEEEQLAIIETDLDGRPWQLALDEEPPVKVDDRHRLG